MLVLRAHNVVRVDILIPRLVGKYQRCEEIRVKTLFDEFEPLLAIWFGLLRCFIGPRLAGFLHVLL